MLHMTRDIVFTMAEGIIRVGDVAVFPLWDPSLRGSLTRRGEVFVAIPRILIDPCWILTSHVATPPGLLEARWQVLFPVVPGKWKMSAGQFFFHDDGSFNFFTEVDTLRADEGQDLRAALLARRQVARQKGYYDEAVEAMLRLYDTASTPEYRNVLWVDAFWNFVTGKETHTVVFGWETAEVLFVPGRGLEPTPRKKGGNGGDLVRAEPSLHL